MGGEYDGEGEAGQCREGEEATERASRGPWKSRVDQKVVQEELETLLLTAQGLVIREFFGLHRRCFEFVAPREGIGILGAWMANT